MEYSPPPKTRHMPLVSAVLDDGSIVETVYSPAEHLTRFCISQEEGWRFDGRVAVRGMTCVPYSPSNNLLRHDVVLFPAAPREYGSVAELVATVQSFVHRHVDVSPLFETIATYYVLLSWLYDAFGELPYLRVKGDYGSGKTRFLLTVGSLCYKPMFASGASTVSPLFRIIDAFQGTLVMDESDFRFSDERADIVKILNNGNARGFPVLRSEGHGTREYDPKAYAVYGPKIIATRAMFDDPALESRCITEDLGLRPLRSDIPITLPEAFRPEALEIRNQLLLYRFNNRTAAGNVQTTVDHGIEPRLSQIFAPLLSVIDDRATAEAILEMALASSRQLVMDRGMAVEAQVLEVLQRLLENGGSVSLRQVAAAFLERFGEEYEGRVSARWLGSMMRRRLQLKPQKSHGIYVLPASEFPKVKRLCERFGVANDA